MKPILLMSMLILVMSCTTRDQNYIESSDGIQIYYKQKGNSDIAIILIHGLGFTSDEWTEQFDSFTKTNKVVMLDLPGFGKSGKNRQNWTIENYGNDIENLVTKLNLNKVIIVGHSMGGLVALSAATKIPEKLKCLVLVDLLNDVNNSHLDDTQIEDLITSWKGIWKKGNIEGFKPFFKKPEFAVRANRMFPDTIPNLWWEALRNLNKWTRDESKPTLKQIQAPIYSINSDRTVTDIEAMKQYVKNYHAIIIPNTSHYINWDKPKEFNEALESIVNQNSK